MRNNDSEHLVFIGSIMDIAAIVDDDNAEHIDYVRAMAAIAVRSERYLKKHKQVGTSVKTRPNINDRLLEKQRSKRRAKQKGSNR